MTVPPGLVTPPSLQKPGEKPDPTAKVCHKFKIPVALPQEQRVPGTDMVQVNVQTHMAFVQCVKEKCTLWNETKLKCAERLAMDAEFDNIEVQRQILAHLRIVEQNRLDTMTVDSGSQG